VHLLDVWARSATLATPRPPKNSRPPPSCPGWWFCSYITGRALSSRISVLPSSSDSRNRRLPTDFPGFRSAENGKNATPSSTPGFLIADR